ncbi:Protein CBG15661 [Caenorhabditis briggsae]|uniref:Galectin n=1 Tax=Caenorhabditis briggsae TaxID=6238 RepID=A8XMH3_CAEBR|nr:Protein CBG15661 [Caenorhabditis briggsae]CAP33849.2 Protein CBG15661 [Caenorhabditis briggsae]
MPFKREINTGCPVGTNIEIAGKPYDDLKKSIFLVLSTNNNDMALRIELLLGQPSKLKIDCTVSQKTSTAIEIPVLCPLNQRAVLRIVTLQHSFQIFFNDAKVADFVHRVDPSLVKTVLLTGPLITEEVIITPPAAATLPTYEQATSPPVELMANLNLSNSNNLQKIPLEQQKYTNDLPPPPASVLQPTAPAGTLPMTAATTAAPGTSTTSSSFFYTGNSQGFSAHPYPLPGLIDNGTYPSQQNTVGHLPPPPQTSAPSAPPIAQAPPTQRAPVVTAPPVQPVAGHYAATPTFPQTAASTPIAQPPPIAQPRPYYQNQQQLPPGYNPYVPNMQQSSVAQVPYPQVVQQPQVQYPAPVPQTYMYPQATPMIQPYPVYQQYPMGYGYAPEVIYYESGHHHHHHGFFGHHHHHCD